MTRKPVKWSEEELAWVKANCTLPRREAHQRFCKVFARTDISFENYKALCTRKGWKTGRDGRYLAGSVPSNKGQKMPYNANSAKTQFKKGCRKGRANENYKPIGSEVVRDDGYIYRKVNDDMPLHHRWRPLHVLRWEEVNGPIPEGHCLKSLDGDRTNTNPENWVCVSRSMLPRLAGRWAVGYDEAPKELKPSILAVAKLEDAARKAGKKDSN